MFMRCKLKTKYGFETRPGFKYSLSLSPSLTLSTLPHLKIGFSARDTRIDRIVLLQYSLLVLDTLSQFKASLQKMQISEAFWEKRLEKRVEKRSAYRRRTTRSRSTTGGRASRR